MTEQQTGRTLDEAAGHVALIGKGKSPSVMDQMFSEWVDGLNKRRAGRVLHRALMRTMPRGW